mmetsp:Transcript_13380/g.31399  ORF Transcript_13380/g.31399 Transcript_13380/m.31399 type:complete len:216 (+) Transcript_13380:77-724(+)|eukprot:CAMPEP_0178390100 /NCGR_PEP_ID=MMETSP0689_2-20121128/10470_1 /TAXON_ID=160604 /ORGANISM="Amphidinium massartii, Strain CS-259" /LENGTH=215 /DNA_ID=CAMNT_0020010595 /DNA_START=81 /DNA_END=728 /DNA_ORIENTATION=-
MPNQPNITIINPGRSQPQPPSQQRSSGSSSAQEYVDQVAQLPVVRQVARRFQRLPREGQLMAGLVGIAVGASVLINLLQALFAAATSMMLVFVGAYLAAKRPAIESFEPAFANWFAKDYYPKIAAELTTRQRLTKWFIDQLGSGQTAVYRFWAARCLPAEMSDWLLFRTAWVNLGSKQSPQWMLFFGIGGGWVPAPRIKVDGKNLSMLDNAASTA